MKDAEFQCAGQEPLPFDDVIAGPVDVTTWPGYRDMVAAADRHEELWQIIRYVAIGPARAAARFGLKAALAVGGATALLHSVPYENTANGIPYSAEATLVGRPGINLETTFGSLEFPTVDSLPVGVTITPRDVDIVEMARDVAGDVNTFSAGLQTDIKHQAPGMEFQFAAELVLGASFGLLGAKGAIYSARFLRDPREKNPSVGSRARRLGAAVVVAGVAVGYGAASYNPDWARESRLTAGTLRAANDFPGQLDRFYSQQSKVKDVLSAVAQIQAMQALGNRGETADAPAFNIMFISDMHLAALYPVVEQYAKEFDVRLIINTGDESEFGTAAELTPGYVAGIRHLTRQVPMIWLAGNHDSPDVVRIMASIPRVTVIGKKGHGASGYTVGAERVEAYGLDVAGIPDIRVYGANGSDGKDDPKITDPLERHAVDSALEGSNVAAPVDIFATHEPVAADEIIKVLGAQRIRQVNSGHTHQQNGIAEVDAGPVIKLNEGSTGAGGLDHLGANGFTTPMEFSVESVGRDCQFTRVVRDVENYNPMAAAKGEPTLTNRSIDTIYLRPQKVSADRHCGTELGISKVEDFLAPLTVAEGK